MREQDGHICPTCEREFKELWDYPRVFIASVSVITPDEVPAEIPHWYKEDLLEAPKEGWNRNLVPAEVLEYFHANPDINRLVHTDSFIYLRPYNQAKEYRMQRVSVNADRYERQFNYASTIKALLEQNVSVREYLESLKQMVGREVSAKKVFPEWQQHYFPSVFQVPSGFGVPNTDGFLLNLHEAEKNAVEYRVAELGIWGSGPNMGSAGGPTIRRILQIGTLSYEGRINQH